MKNLRTEPELKDFFFFIISISKPIKICEGSRWCCNANWMCNPLYIILNRLNHFSCLQSLAAIFRKIWEFGSIFEICENLKIEQSGPQTPQILVKFHRFWVVISDGVVLFVKHPKLHNSDSKLQFYWTSTDIEIMINRATLPRGIAPHCRSRLGPGECFCPEKVLNSSFCWATTLHLGGDNTQDFCQTYR